jgi:hypothetical protein
VTAVGLAHDRVREAKAHAIEDLLVGVYAQAATAEAGTDGYGFENIVGVGIGERHMAGRTTGEPAVTVYVVVKAPPEQVETAALVPNQYDGVPTDVVESGEFVAAGQRGRFRPATPGVSAAHFRSGAGTLGFVARQDAAFCIVSNNHVFARENEGSHGDLILQPSRLDGGTPETDAIGELIAWTPLAFDGTPTYVDAAIAQTEESLVDEQVPALGGVLYEPLAAEQGFIVRKRGRTTGLTRGHIHDPEATLKVRYRTGSVLLSEQFLVKGLDGVPFSESGDSGSLVVEERTRQPVGLLCGGSVRFTIVTPIHRVLETLALSFVT